MRTYLTLAIAVLGAWLFTTAAAQADGYWRVTSPDHGQTFAYGSEQNRVWAERGRDRHLVVLMTFTNDPYVDRQNPRETDDFTFSFPEVKLGSDGHTFFYHAPNGRTVPVAEQHPSFLGINQIRLLPTAALEIRKPHGYLTLTLVFEG
jgi:hypothetical protein